LRAEWDAEKEAREPHGDLLCALRSLLDLPPPAAMRVYGYRHYDHAIDPLVGPVIDWLTTYCEFGRFDVQPLFRSVREGARSTGSAMP
jgi:hypothetical protein